MPCERGDELFCGTPSGVVWSICVHRSSHLPTLIPFLLAKMLSRNESNSHQGEDGGEEATETTVSIGGRCVRHHHHPSEGLRILIHHKEQATNVVIKAKMMMMTRKLVSQACHLPKGLPELDFLKRCFLCRRELSPCKDVYMYRYFLSSYHFTLSSKWSTNLFVLLFLLLPLFSMIYQVDSSNQQINMHVSL